MENHDNTFNTICRVCLQHDKVEEMASLLNNSDENALNHYGELFEKFTKIPVKQNHYLPLKICKKCKKTLDDFVTFIAMSEISDQKLSKLISFSVKQDLSSDMVQEVLLQYTIFNQNFPDKYKPTSSPNMMKPSNEETFCVKNTKLEGKQYNNIKVEIDIQKISQNDSDNDIFESIDDEKFQADNVDIFLYSIEKFVTTKVGRHQPVKHMQQSKKSMNVKDHDQDFTCNICHRTLANPATYKYHMQRHGICRFVCDQCGKGFPVLAELTQHQIYRHGIGSSLECDQCSFKAARRLELIEHIRLHTGERPFTCEKCGLTFRRKAIYKNHLKSHGEKSVQCDYCPRKFYRKCQMLAHSNNVHDRVYAFLCKICHVTYAMAKTVRRHMLVKHGIPRNMQGKVVRINKNNDNKFFKDR